MRIFHALLLTLPVLSMTVLAGCQSGMETVRGEETAVLTDAPQVPPPITRRYPTRVIVNLEVQEVIGRLADGVQYRFWTFGGHVPGKFIRVRQDDIVEIHLHNPATSMMAHSIDLHAVTGPGGGSVSTETAPGHTSVFSFKALHPGLFAYHCATMPMGMHIANGMYGMILVEPRNGLPHVDHEYYLMQSEFYTKGAYGDPGVQAFDLQKALDERPSYVVFNGSVGAVMGDHALQAKVGDTVRLYVGNIGPNLASSFHIVGTIMRNVHLDGSSVIAQNVQTTLIPAGGAVTIELKIQEPGNYAFLDHSMFRAMGKGAIGMIHATGPQDKSIYSGKIRDEVDPPSMPLASAQAPLQAPGQAPAASPRLRSIAQTKTQRIEAGRAVFHSICINCHQAHGQGLAGVFPPLAKSDFLNADKTRAIGIVMSGRSGTIRVNGQTIVGAMPELGLKDEQIANVLTFVYNSWGNSGKDVTAQEVEKVRGARVAKKNQSLLVGRRGSPEGQAVRNN